VVGHYGDRNGFKVQAYISNHDPKLYEELMQHMKFFILSVNMVSTKKAKVKKVRRKMCVISSPQVKLTSSTNQENKDNYELVDGMES
jgi:hypothetical protein